MPDFSKVLNELRKMKGFYQAFADADVVVEGLQVAHETLRAEQRTVDVARTTLGEMEAAFRAEMVAQQEELAERQRLWKEQTLARSLVAHEEDRALQATIAQLRGGMEALQEEYESRRNVLEESIAGLVAEEGRLQREVRALEDAMAALLAKFGR